jgi:hypothetical protein
MVRHQPDHQPMGASASAAINEESCTRIKAVCAHHRQQCKLVQRCLQLLQSWPEGDPALPERIKGDVVGLFLPPMRMALDKLIPMSQRDRQGQYPEVFPGNCGQRLSRCALTVKANCPYNAQAVKDAYSYLMSPAVRESVQLWLRAVPEQTNTWRHMRELLALIDAGQTKRAIARERKKAGRQRQLLEEQEQRALRADQQLNESRAELVHKLESVCFNKTDELSTEAWEDLVNERVGTDIVVVSTPNSGDRGFCYLRPELVRFMVDPERVAYVWIDEGDLVGVPGHGHVDRAGSRYYKLPMGIHVDRDVLLAIRGGVARVQLVEADKVRLGTVDGEEGMIGTLHGQAEVQVYTIAPEEGEDE